MSATYYKVLGDAIRDMAEHGYDNAARLQDWLRKLRIAAMIWLPSEEDSMNQMQSALSTAFKRSISKNAITKHHPGIGRFTIHYIEPRLRMELDRRILASADLIKLNRTQAIEKTLQRFSGWATSIPSGGSSVVDFRETQENIGKPLKQVKFEQRRVEIDQGHKLMNSINAVVAEQTGALAAIWRSNYRQPGYDYREDHKDRDGKVYAIKGNWAIEKGLMKKGSAGYIDEITQPGEEVFCRCWFRYITNLRDLPEEMLTQRGKEFLATSPFRKT